MSFLHHVAHDRCDTFHSSNQYCLVSRLARLSRLLSDPPQLRHAPDTSGTTRGEPLNHLTRAMVPGPTEILFRGGRMMTALTTRAQIPQDIDVLRGRCSILTTTKRKGHPPDSQPRTTSQLGVVLLPVRQRPAERHPWGNQETGRGSGGPPRKHPAGEGLSQHQPPGAMRGAQPGLTPHEPWDHPPTHHKGMHLFQNPEGSQRADRMNGEPPPNHPAGEKQSQLQADGTMGRIQPGWTP
jgi:hypothetical protein